jgi:hypothetical protein
MSSPTVPYVLGGASTERDRLIAQVDGLEWALDRIALGPGLRVVDFDCGPIGIMNLLSERVGSESELARLSSLRTVIAVADRMPDLGRRIYETGPVDGIAKLATYLRAQVDAGVLAIEDCEVAAAQFIESCHATMFKPLLFNAAPPPTPEGIAYVVGIAVRTFLAAYRVKH